MGQTFSDWSGKHSFGAHRRRTHSEEGTAGCHRDLYKHGPEISRGGRLSMSLRIAIVGYGKMGRSIERLAPEHDCEVVGTFRSAENQNGEALNCASLRDVDVAIEFSTPHTAAQNILRLVDAGIPIVTGTTGWFKELPEIREHVLRKNGSVVWAA